MITPPTIEPTTTLETHHGSLVQQLSCDVATNTDLTLDGLEHSKERTPVCKDMTINESIMALETSRSNEKILEYELYNLKAKVDILQSQLADAEHTVSVLSGKEQQVDKVKVECGHYKAALNTCRKRIQSLENTSSLVSDPVMKDGYATPDKMAASIEQFTHILQDGNSGISLSPQKHRKEYFKLIDSLEQLRKVVDKNMCNL